MSATSVPPAQMGMLDPVSQGLGTMSIQSIVDQNSQSNFVSQQMGHSYDYSQSPVPVTPRYYAPELVYGNSTSDESPLYSSDSCYSPNPAEYPRPHIAGQSYLPSHEQQHSPSLMPFEPYNYQIKSPLCSTATLPAWTENSLPPQDLASSEQFEGPFLQPVGTPHLARPDDEHVAHSFLDSIPIPLSDLDRYEWCSIRGVFSKPAGGGVAKHGVLVGNLEKLKDYLDCYWLHFHPVFPIIHRPTFLRTVPPPLMAAAMISIGAQFSTQPHSKSYSTLMHEACLRLLPTVSTSFGCQPPFTMCLWN